MASNLLLARISGLLAQTLQMVHSRDSLRKHHGHITSQKQNKLARKEMERIWGNSGLESLGWSLLCASLGSSFSYALCFRWYRFCITCAAVATLSTLFL